MLVSVEIDVRSVSLRDCDLSSVSHLILHAVRSSAPQATCTRQFVVISFILHLFRLGLRKRPGGMAFPAGPFFSG